MQGGSPEHYTGQTKYGQKYLRLILDNQPLQTVACGPTWPCLVQDSYQNELQSKFLTILGLKTSVQELKVVLLSLNTGQEKQCQDTRL